MNHITLDAGAFEEVVRFDKDCVGDRRGENRDAVACYRRVLEIINRTPDDFDPEYTQRFVDQIEKLDPTQAP